MNILLIESHPYEKSFCRGVSEEIKTNTISRHNLEIIDLIKDKFNPVVTKADLEAWTRGESIDPLVKKYQTKITNCDLMIFPFPIWWGTMPAVLKGFIDKIFLKDFAYRYNQLGQIIGLFQKEAIVIQTSANDNKVINEVFQDPVKHHFIMNTLNTCGIQLKKYFQIDNLGSNAELAKTKMAEISTYFKEL